MLSKFMYVSIYLQIDYDAVIGHILHLREHQVKIITSDFEAAVWQSIRGLLPNVRIVGCLFHYNTGSSTIYTGYGSATSVSNGHRDKIISENNNGSSGFATGTYRTSVQYYIRQSSSSICPFYTIHPEPVDFRGCFYSSRSVRVSDDYTY